MLPNRWRSTSKKRGGGQGVEGGGEGGKLCESPRVQGRCLLANLVKTICLNYTKMNSGSAKAVHLSRYVEKTKERQKGVLYVHVHEQCLRVLLRHLRFYRQSSHLSGPHSLLPAGAKSNRAWIN